MAKTELSGLTWLGDAYSVAKVEPGGNVAWVGNAHSCQPVEWNQVAITEMCGVAWLSAYIVISQCKWNQVAIPAAMAELVTLGRKQKGNNQIVDTIHSCNDQDVCHRESYNG